MDKGSKPKSEDKIEAILHEATREQLCDVIRKKAEWDDSFRAHVLMCLGAPDLKEAMDAVKERIRIAIRQNTQRGYIDWKGCDAICLEMEDCLDTTKSLYLDRYPAIAFEIALYVFLTGIKLASTADSSSGGLGCAVSQAMELLLDICEGLESSQDAGLQKSCYEKLCKEALNKALDGWDDWSYSLLEIAALLVTRLNVSKLEAALAERRRRDTQRDYISGFTDLVEAKIRLKVTEMLDGTAAARAFIDAHLDLDEMRLLAVRQDMDSGAYQNAERLCLERLTLHWGGDLLMCILIFTLR